MSWQDRIDSLMERYLHLVDEYAHFREQLNTSQARIYQDIARANFVAERGARYGQDAYDERMQASRRLRVEYKPASCLDSNGAAAPSESFANFAIVRLGVVGETVAEAQAREGQKLADFFEKQASISENKEAESGDVAQLSTELENTSISCSHEAQDPDTTSASPDSSSAPTKKEFTNPLRWFGVLTPLALHEAQSESEHAVKDVVPRLASVSSEMRALEIEIRRARKKRAKEEAASGKPPESRESRMKGVLEM